MVIMPNHTSNFQHYSILLSEIIEQLSVKPNGTYLDGTLGLGGHSLEILKRLDNQGLLIAFDLDKKAIEMATNRFESAGYKNFTIINDNYANVKEQLNALEITNLDGVLVDLGVSSMQLDDGGRGFSYHQDAKLDMRMNQDYNLSAYEVVNEYDENSLSRIFWLYGEETFSKRIASAIIKSRLVKPIETTFELVEIIKSALPKKILYTMEKHPARKVFQAIRIEVNQELKSLEKFLNDILDFLKPNAKLCVITFHSLEDRIVKQFFVEKTTSNLPSKLPIKAKDIQINYQLVNKKPITPSEQELLENSRSRSAKLRIIQKK